MSRFIKLFRNHQEYDSYAESNEYIEPHVSVCRVEGHINYNKKGSTRVTFYDGWILDDYYMNFYNSEGKLLGSFTGNDISINIPSNGELYVDSVGGIISFDGEEAIVYDGIPDWKGHTYVWLYRNVPTSTKVIKCGVYS